MNKGYTVIVEEGIATLELKLPGKVNKIGEPFVRALSDGLVDALAAEDVRGIILASGHRDFCVGADIDMLYKERDPARMLEVTTVLNALYRRFEQCGKPVVCALTGSALGGGYELALACHRRIALDSPKIQVGLPEIGLGVIPGAGGTQRLPYLIGLQAALEHIAAGQPVRVPKAKKMGMVCELAQSREELFVKARAFIDQNPNAKQPWDTKGAVFPGGVQPGTPDSMMLFVGASAFIAKRTAGVFPAAQSVLEVISQGTRMKFDRALELEGRHFAKLATSDQAKDMIRTLWYHRTAAEKLGVGMEHGIGKVTILGAGMMGAGLGFIAARAGCQVVLKDIREEALVGARGHCEAQAHKMKHLSPEAREEVLSRIVYTLENEPIRGSDLIIEAVVENVAVKHAVTRELEPLLSENGIWASNTSAIPITRLAEASEHKDRFIGMHFFSPVEKMPLLEVIQPEACSAETLERVLGFGKALKKTNIVVNDGYGFFTTRLFAAYILEGAQLAAEGHDPILIERAAKTVGMIMPPLKVFDEITLTLGVHVFDSRKEITGEALDLSGVELIRKMVELGRHGRAAGQGFYDWDQRVIWSGLGDLVDEQPEETGLTHLQRRLLIAQIAEVGRVLDDGIIRDHKDVEVGAILGLGFAPNTGGPLAWMDRQGLPALVREMTVMAERYGKRYAPSAFLMRMAESGERFWEAG